MLSSLEDTISAIITPIGEGGIAVIRLSGKRSFEIASRHFRGHVKLITVASHTAHVGYFLDENAEVIDEVVVTVFKSPHSYTTEDCVEISCHGSMFIARRILNVCIKAGTRHADPGEFTKRAFLHGRIDLTQAEAVAALIHSHSEAAHRSSLNQLQGMHTNIFSNIHDELVNICSLLELDLDFTEENISIIETNTCINKIEAVKGSILGLIESYEFGRVIRDGVKVVLTGSPNVGKSSILNALLNQNRSIVTDISGTTRDTIEEQISFEGLRFRLVDSAGIRETSDEIESEGIKRSYAEIKQANIVAYVIDISRFDTNVETERVESLLSQLNINESSLLIVYNKADLLLPGSKLNAPNGLDNYSSVIVSAKCGIGVFELKKAIYEMSTIRMKMRKLEEVTITSSRHIDSLLSAKESIERSLASIHAGASNEFVVVDLRKAIHAFDQITGRVTSEDILNKIFSGFCIGK
jgi:tRNA modification GTPase